jgi:pimeloyl-ACP methyl ester carboxylesterase
MPSTKRFRILTWLKWIGLGLVSLVLLALIGGASFEAAARAHARKTYPPRGQMVDIGGRKIHVDCRGQGTPTVILESGLDTGGSLAWSKVHDQIAAVTRTCAYDRAGIMWSDRKPGIHDTDGVADDLHATLNAMGEKGPVVMVAHSLGGPLVMDFTRKYGDQVAGVVFVDASHADQLKRMKAAGINIPDVPPVMKALVAVTWTGWTRIPSGDSGVPNMPPAAAAAAKAYMSVSVPAALKEEYAIDTIFAQGGKLRTLGDRPLVVLTATKPLPAENLAQLKMTRADANKLQAVWIALHNDEASWSTRSRHQLVPDATHYIQFDRPDVVIAAVKEVVADVRGESAPPAAAKQ